MYSSENINDNLLEELRIRIILLIGDNISTEVNFHGEHSYSINVIFIERGFWEHSDFKDVNTEGKNIYIESIEEILKEQLKKINNIPTQSASESSHLEEGSLLALKLQEDDQTASNLIRELSELKVNFKILKHAKWTWNAGAGSFGEELILWIGNAIAGGVTWDLIKFQSLKYVPKEGSHLLNSSDYHKIVKHVSKITKENSTDLLLLEIESIDQELYKIVFQSSFKQIEVHCDKKGNVINLYNRYLKLF